MTLTWGPVDLLMPSKYRRDGWNLDKWEKSGNELKRKGKIKVWLISFGERILSELKNDTSDIWYFKSWNDKLYYK